MSLVKNAGPYGLITDQATPKTTPVDADSIGLSDSADSGFLKKLTWANLKATLISTAMTWTGKQTFDGGAAIKGATSAVDAGYVGNIAAIGQEVERLKKAQIECPARKRAESWGLSARDLAWLLAFAGGIAALYAATQICIYVSGDRMGSGTVHNFGVVNFRFSGTATIPIAGW
jgi:hypothetical protein